MEAARKIKDGNNVCSIEIDVINKKLNKIPRIPNKDVQSFPTAFMSISVPDKEVCQKVNYFKSTPKNMPLMYSNNSQS